MAMRVRRRIFFGADDTTFINRHSITNQGRRPSSASHDRLIVGGAQAVLMAPANSVRIAVNPEPRAVLIGSFREGPAFGYTDGLK